MILSIYGRMLFGSGRSGPRYVITKGMNYTIAPASLHYTL